MSNIKIISKKNFAKSELGKFSSNNFFFTKVYFYLEHVFSLTSSIYIFQYTQTIVI